MIKYKAQLMQNNFFHKAFKMQQKKFHYKFKKAFITRYIVKKQYGIYSKSVPDIGHKKTANYFNKRIFLFHGISPNEFVKYTFTLYKLIKKSKICWTTPIIP